jgi:hypothetical protein
VSGAGAGREAARGPMAGEDGALRAEHDALAERLSARRSIDLARRAAYTGFAGFLATGLAVKLAFDRWFSNRPARFRGPPLFFFVALAAALVLVLATALVARRSRAHMREEDAAFGRLRRLRAALGLDP